MSKNDVRLERAWGCQALTKRARQERGTRETELMSQQLPLCVCPEARLRVRAAFTEARILKQGHWGGRRIEEIRQR